jgi:hypothetical protein
MIHHQFINLSDNFHWGHKAIDVDIHMLHFELHFHHQEQHIVVNLHKGCC